MITFLTAAFDSWYSSTIFFILCTRNEKFFPSAYGQSQGSVGEQMNDDDACMLVVVITTPPPIIITTITIII